MQKTITFPDLLKLKGELRRMAGYIYETMKSHLDMQPCTGHPMLIASGTGEDGQVGNGDLITVPFDKLAGIRVQDNKGEELDSFDDFRYVLQIVKDDGTIEEVLIQDYTFTASLESWALANFVTIIAK